MRAKQDVLRYMIKNNVETVDSVGRVMAEYYTDNDNLMKHVRQNKLLGD
jgi:hypothetical protein